MFSPACFKRAVLRLVAVAPKADLLERVSVLTVNDGLLTGVLVLARGVDERRKDDAMDCGR